MQAKRAAAQVAAALLHLGPWGLVHDARGRHSASTDRHNPAQPPCTHIQLRAASAGHGLAQIGLQVGT